VVDRGNGGPREWRTWTLRSPPTPRGTWGNLGETRGGVGKSGVRSTKAAISLKRVKIEEKLLWRPYTELQTLFQTVLSPTTYGLPFTKIGGSQLHPKTAIAIISRTAKVRTANLADTFIGPSEQSPWKILEKRERGRIQGFYVRQPKVGS